MKKILELISEEMQKAFEDAGYNKELGRVTVSNRPDLCEYQCNGAMAGAKQYKKAPIMIANEVVEKLADSNVFESVEAVMPGFLNLKVKPAFLKEYLQGMRTQEKFGVAEPTEKKTIIVDYGGPNVAKPLHVGHLRSAVIGESVKRICRFMGHNVIGDIHLGDWGLQMGLTIAQLQDDGYIDGYFDKSKKNKEITLDTLNEEYPKASVRKNVDEDFRKKAEDYTKFVQDKKEPYWSVYNHIRDISVSRIKANYETLNCYFDLWYGESNASEYVDTVVKTFIDKGLTREHEGAIIVDVAKEGENIPIEKKNPDDPQLYKNPMPPVFLKKSNGADVYDTTDIATIYQRNKERQPISRR